MNQKQRKAISNGVAVIYLLTGLFFYWVVFSSNNIYIFFGIVLATPVVEVLVSSILPGGKNSRKPKTNKVSNRLRTDEAIIKSRLEDLSWREFERLCFLYYKAKGYKPRETGEGADGGVDLIIYNRYHKADEAIQIKHYLGSGNQITVKQIRELNSAKRNHKCTLSRFITSSGYTRDALRQADDYKMVCHDLNWVKSKIVKWQEQERRKVG
ncbi:restriction endonuclease [Alkalihalobacillus sp. MEB130]|uniref:restriction endonuclease n=1 Tax=Alkalihalobacillus sp. MEB130 TaxID=2976704 RepID=UPI0028E046F2|nr:restriction endonuclease [Alkalihalobacillus sp. MEB130]MDT8860300.1 restriction endonuclease [Alkalihalobacillus sp. MEB130]